MVQTARWLRIAVGTFVFVVLKPYLFKLTVFQKRLYPPCIVCTCVSAHQDGKIYVVVSLQKCLPENQLW